MSMNAIVLIIVSIILFIGTLYSLSIYLIERQAKNFKRYR